MTVGDEEIETTIEHPFYVEGIGFVSAKNLQPGDIIRTSDGQNLPIQKVEIEELEEPVLVYNFEVEDFHTYYVSELGVLVHNNCSGETGENDFIVDSYKNMRKNKNIKGQAHHLSQDAAFKGVIPYRKGLSVKLEGNAFTDIGSGHYEAHKYMEAFWNQYRPDGALYGTKPTIAQYNRAVYGSLKAAGLTDSNAAYAVKCMYEQQLLDYGLKNTNFVPHIPGKLNQKKPR